MSEVNDAAVQAAWKAYDNMAGYSKAEKIRAALEAGAPHMQGVTVKELEWRSIQDGGYWTASETVNRQYSIGYEEGKFWANWDVRLPPFETGEAAKAAAQSDYDALILSAIETVPTTASLPYVRREALETVAWQHPKMKWVDTLKQKVQMHCMPGDKAEPLVTRANAEAYAAGLVEKMEKQIALAEVSLIQMHQEMNALEATIAEKDRQIAELEETVRDDQLFAKAIKATIVEKDRHTDDMNDLVLMGMARDEAVSRAETAEAELAKARKALVDAFRQGHLSGRCGGSAESEDTDLEKYLVALNPGDV